VSEFDKSNSYTTPTQLRWKPKPVDTVEESAPIDFVEGLYTVCGAGSSFLRHGFAIHMYACIVLPIISTVTMDVWNLSCFLFRYTANKSMDDCAFCNADGDFLIVPQKGSE
jgi:homogentisate 1,2-dioxygenase